MKKDKVDLATEIALITMALIVFIAAVFAGGGV